MSIIIPCLFSCLVVMHPYVYQYPFSLVVVKRNVVYVRLIPGGSGGISSSGSTIVPVRVLLQRRRWSGGVHGSVSIQRQTADPLTIRQPASPQFTSRHTLQSERNRITGMQSVALHYETYRMPSLQISGTTMHYTRKLAE